MHLIASAHTLDGFAFQHGDADGVDVRELAAGANVIVRTRNSCYRLVMVEPETQRVLVSGGDWFPEPTKAQLVGASRGGNMLKPGWIGAVAFAECALYLMMYNTAAPKELLFPKPPVVDFLKKDNEMFRIMGDGVFPPNTGPGIKGSILVEVTWDGQRWHELEFVYALSNAKSPPKFIAPYHPRSQ